MKTAIKIILTIALTIGIAKSVFRLGWISKAIDTPLGYKTLLRAFGTIGPKDAEDIIFYFILTLALIIARSIILGAFLLAASRPKENMISTCHSQLFWNLYQLLQNR